MSTQTNQLLARNVEVFDADGNVIAGFWQYGTLSWDEFHSYLSQFVITGSRWSIFQYDTVQKQRGVLCQPSPQIVQPGQYILLTPAGGSIRVDLVARPVRLRIPTHSNTPAREHYYRSRGRARDGKCLITGLQTLTFRRLKVAHIFPRAHDAEWIRKGYPSKITDTADEACMGGPSKIDSVQNVITLRSDLHDAWDNYEFGVNPNNNYRVTAFTNGNADINGLHLQLDHIEDPTMRPLDELLIDHFMQGIFKHMRGVGEPEWKYEDYDDVFRDGSFDLTNPKIWETREGKQGFELALADRLHTHRVAQQSAQATV
ncbi:hypothetical protein NLJ89_g10332 [Agrocybe chaxingu]|uniref:HNH nuclease domain-containing protein n=1 Tax=Agrocybe chaxingu TaxID=84603 RepID=A0A9W8JRY8_9AGAR|nr:hypothetical protein NLJ89_g10332 [Agrocybe chaxingu]